MTDLDPKAVWTDKHGQKFVIAELTDDHLNNILKFLYRTNIRKLREKLRQEAADFKAEAEREESFFYDIDDPPSYTRVLAGERLDLASGTDRAVLVHYVPQLPALEWEARRRGLLKPMTGLRGNP